MIVLSYIISLCVFSLVFAVNTVYLNNYSDDKIDITCHVKIPFSNTSSKVIPEITWYKDSTKLANNQSSKDCNQNTCKSILTISSTDSVGTYKCKTKDKTSLFEVLEMGVASNPSVIQKENFRKDVMLTAFLSRYHNYTVTWYRKGVLINNDGIKNSITNNDTLIIHNFGYNDLGDYEVKAISDDNILVNTTFNLQSSPIRHGKTDTSKNMVQGEVLILHCGINGIPMPNVTWFKNDLFMVANDHVSFHDLIDPKLNLPLVDGTLRIEDIDFPDRANYTCRAKNHNGVQEIVVLVRIKDKLAALWPFLGICAEVIILCAIILFYERMRAKKMHDEDMEDEANFVASHNSATKNDEVRLRK